MRNPNERELAIKRRQNELAAMFEEFRTDGEWHRRDGIPCQTSNDDFFPERRQYTDHRVKKTVARNCDRCPVRALCLRDALADPTTRGIWGGMLFPGALMKFDAEEFLDMLIWDTYTPNIVAGQRELESA